MPARQASGSWGACIFLVLINTAKQPSRVAVARSRAWIIVECGDHLGEPAFLDAKPASPELTGPHSIFSAQLAPLAALFIIRALCPQQHQAIVSCLPVI